VVFVGILSVLYLVCVSVFSLVFLSVVGLRVRHVQPFSSVCPVGRVLTVVY